MKYNFSRNDKKAHLFKVTLLLNKSPDMTENDFKNSWISYRRKEGVVKGKICHVFNSIDTRGVQIKTSSQFACSGIEELWFDNKHSARDYIRAILSEIHKRNILNDLLNIENSAICIGKCHSIIDKPLKRPELLVKILILNNRRQTMSRHAYRNYWINYHGTLVKNAPEAEKRHYRIEYCPVDYILSSMSSGISFDGVATIQFQSLEDQKASLESSYYKEILAQDEIKFSDSGRSFGAMAVEVNLL